MSNCIKDLFVYNLVKQCCRCQNILLKSNFHKDNKRKDGLYNQCKICRKEYYFKSSFQLIQKQKDYYLENRDSELERCKQYRILNREKINLYEKNKRKIDFNFKIAHNIRARTRQAFKAQNVRKTRKTFELIGCSQSFFKRWILHQLYGDMIEENYGEIWCLDHC